MEGQNTESKTVLSEDVEITGTVKAANSLQMDGKLNGDLNCSSSVAIGKTANIKGNIAVGSVTVNGQIYGNIVAKDRIELKAAARINGDIKAKRLTVEDGVSFVGKVEVNPSGAVGGKSTPDVSSAVQNRDDLLNEMDNMGERGDDKKKGSSLLGRK